MLIQDFKRKSESIKDELLMIKFGMLILIKMTRTTKSLKIMLKM